ncbi:hypothetical protein IPJ70_02575 [Candidatus Campbellbacteria bacterium]|nr:MAG: hypothetical protein IPJ70_02575 [Candidatus Campbellbacteria bacterium]
MLDGERGRLRGTSGLSDSGVSLRSRHYHDAEELTSSSAPTPDNLVTTPVKLAARIDEIRFRNAKRVG